MLFQDRRARYLKPLLPQRVSGCQKVRTNEVPTSVPPPLLGGEIEVVRFAHRPNYYTHTYVPVEQRYASKSCRTTDLEIAKERAIQLLPHAVGANQKWCG